MFRPIRILFRTVVLLKLLALAFSAGMAAAYVVQLRQHYRTWGRAPGGDARDVTGDELVPEADVTETRIIDIDVPPDQVWPWLAQMGYGRGGWYSRALDRAWSPGGGPTSESADVVLDEFQDLAVGDLVPTHPQGGFEARVVEPGEALVLFLDDSMMREQVEELVAEQTGDEAAAAQVGLDMPPYRASWAFTLEERPGGRTRLLERLRFTVDVSESQKKALPLLELGVFMLMRGQMLGIKQRAEGRLVVEG